MTQTDCPQSSFNFQDLGSRKIQANFQGGRLSSDGGGALFLREVEERCGLIKRFSQCFEDRRNPKLIEHPVAHLLAQRINGLILGYEDLNDHDDLRCDPALALSVGKTDIEGKTRRDPKDRGKAFAAHATLNRLELSAQAPDERYKKIIADPAAIESFIIAQGVKAIPKKSKEIVIDFDTTDAPSTASKKEPTSTDTIATTATFRSMPFAETSLSDPSYVSVKLMAVEAPLKHCKKSFPPSASALVKRSASSCVATEVSLGKKSWRGVKISAKSTTASATA